jgi:hypothetical protein
MKKIILSILTISLLGTNLFSKDIKTINDVKEMVEESKTILPRNMNTQMVLMGLSFDEKNKKLKYEISFINLDKINLEMADIRKILIESLKDNICPNKTTKELFKLNINTIYNYSDKYGDYYYGEEVTPDFCELKNKE